MATRILFQLVYLGIGFLASQGTIFDKYAPFGVAVVAAAPFKAILTAGGGALIGYLMPTSSGESVRYLATIIAVMAIRWTLNDLERIRKHPLFAPLVAFVPVLATGLAIASVDGSASAGALLCITESFMAAAASYFFVRTQEVVEKRKGLASLDYQQMACVAFSAGILVLSCEGITIGSLSVGRIVGVVAILFCARLGSAAGGAIAGAAAGSLFGLASPASIYLAGAYGFGGLMAGLFAPLGRVGCACSFILSNAIMVLATGDVTAVIAGLYEVAAATMIFMFLPRELEKPLSALFSRPVSDDRNMADGLRRSVVMRLDYAAKALSDVSDSVEVVSEKLGKLSESDINGVYTRVADTTCRRCGLKNYCWEQNYDGTLDVFNGLTAHLRENGRVEREDFAPYFANTCSKFNELMSNVNRRYAEFTARETAERRVDEVRRVVADQFGGMSEILQDMAGQLKEYQSFDLESAEKIRTFLQEQEVEAIDISCRIDQMGHMNIEIEAPREAAALARSLGFEQKISYLCGRTLDTPCLSLAPDCCRIQLCEMPDIQTELGAAQHACDNGALCGDHYTYFHDGMGRLVAVISDGMGTGGRAAVDGAMAAGILSKLAKAGLSFDCALRIVNSALVVKAGEESLATLDVACVDLYTGRAEFLKAGAPLTLVRRGGEVSRMDASSLPAGILRDISFARETFELEPEDWVLMVSDGAVANGDEWLEDFLAKWEKDDPQRFAEAVVKEAVARRTDGHDDDVTAVAIRVMAS